MNSYKTVKYGKKAERRNYSKVRTEVELPNLIEIQTKSFEQFVESGLGEIFADISPITSYNGDLKIYFGEYHFEDPKYGIVESKIGDVNYSRPLKVKVKLEIASTGNVVEREIFMGEIPYMTPVGTFIINGAERVVISQIVRSAGAYYRKEIDAKSGEVRYAGQVIPTRGAWIEFEAGPRDILYGKLDRSKKIPITTLMRAFGLSTNEQIIDLFGDSAKIRATIEKDTSTNADEGAVEVYSKLRQGERVTPEAARGHLKSHLFDDRRYDLQKVGRFKYNKKLDVFDRAKGHILAQTIIANDDIFDDLTGELTFSKGEVIAEQGELIAGEVLENLKKGRAALRQEIDLGHLLSEEPTYCEIIKVEVIEGDESHIVKIIGSDQREEALHITLSDIIASFGYYFNLFEGVGKCDDIDHLGNRRLRLIGELLKNQFRIGFAKLEKNIIDKMSTADVNGLVPENLINIKPLTASLKEFFGSSQLSQFMDQINPLAEITQKRRVSALGTGGIARDRASTEVRDVHDSHYGRMCPIETPEGPSIGLITSLATYAQVDEYGFIETPYLIVKKDENGVKYVSDDEVYLTADKEEGYVIASASTKLDENGYILEEEVIGRINGETSMVNAKDVDYMDVSPKQVVSVAASCIPFLEHDDATRALMGANMQRQAVPIIAPESPIVGTGMEHRAAKDSGSACVALASGVVEYVDAKIIKVKENTGDIRTYHLNQFLRSNSSTTIWQRPIVSVGEVIDKGDILADGQSMQNGELALGRNVRVGFMTWDGYNFEDAVIMSENMVKNDVYTSVHIDDYDIECRDTKLGKEEFTRDIPNGSDEMVKYLDANGIVIVGTEVKEGDILVGKVTPKGQSDPTPEERLLQAIFGEKSREVRDSSLRVPHGGGGVVRAVEHFKKSNGDELGPGVSEVVRVYIVQKRKISEGDKMAGRHGNKGVISNIVPVEDMPYSEDGRPLDIMLNPQGVPSRMNIGQVLELHLGLAASTITMNNRKKFIEEYKASHNGQEPTEREVLENVPQIKCATPVFDGATPEDLDAALTEAGCPLDGKITLYDGRSGEPFENKINVGTMYMIKLSHMVDDKLHARSVGPYTLVTQQPMGGKAQNGGQRFGEMEDWALQAYGAAHTLQEMLTVKSDDIVGRNKVFNAICNGDTIPESSIPESFRVLTREFQALGLHVELITRDGENEIGKSIVDPDSDNFIKKFGM